MLGGDLLGGDLLGGDLLGGDLLGGDLLGGDLLGGDLLGDILDFFGWSIVYCNLCIDLYLKQVVNEKQIHSNYIVRVSTERVHCILVMSLRERATPRANGICTTMRIFTSSLDVRDVRDALRGSAILPLLITELLRLG